MAEIDIGPGATDRSTYSSTANTHIDKGNPANGNGTIDTFEVWAYSDMNGTNKIGTMYGSGTSWTPRDFETIGTVTSGAKRTFTSLDCDVSTDDLAAIYWSAGDLERDLSGAGYYYKSGDQWGAGTQTYTESTNKAISIYGTGETVEVPKTSSDTGSGVDAKDSASPAAVMTGNDSGYCGQTLIG